MSKSKKPKPWVPVITSMELPDGRTVPAIDDGMFFRLLPENPAANPIGSTDELRAKLGDVYNRVYKSLDEIEKWVKSNLNNRSTEFSEGMTSDARELLGWIVSAKRLIHEKEWELVAPYLLSISGRAESIRIELAYRGAIIAKRGSDSWKLAPRGQTNFDLLALLDEKSGISEKALLRMAPSDAEEALKKLYESGRRDLLNGFDLRMEAFRGALRRWKKAQG
ncbi:MAG: hypothetical protein KIT22_09435 [Verrucomicrobiae bacterium]|nr:hypothetical protein [Verrucomicrobiae bacterium]